MSTRSVTSHSSNPFSMASSMADLESSSNEPSSWISSKETLASLRTRENVYLLVLVLLLSIAYIVQQAIRQRISEKKAFQRKARLLGISPAVPASTASTSHGAGGSSNGGVSLERKEAKPVSILAQHAWTVSKRLHIDVGVDYIRDLSSRITRHVLKAKSKRPRRSTTSSNAIETSTTSEQATKQSGAGGNASQRGRAESNRSSAQNQPKSTNANLQANSPSNTKTQSGRPNGPSRHTSNTATSNSSSRSRSATHSLKQQQQQQQQQRASSIASNSSSSSHQQAIKPVMKSVAIQVELDELAQTNAILKPNGHAQPHAREDSKGKRSIARVEASSSEISFTSSSEEDHLEAETFRLACMTPLPRSPKRGTSTLLSEQGITRSGTITHRSPKTTSKVLSIDSVLQDSSRKSTASNATSILSKAESSAIQSPTCSSSGRSTSLSVSTDATGVTSCLHCDQEMETVHEEGSSSSNASRKASNATKSSGQKVLQPAVLLRTPSQDGSVVEKTSKHTTNGSSSGANLLQYSFHTGFQEPTTLEDGEIEKGTEAGPSISTLSSPQQILSRQSEEYGLYHPDSVSGGRRGISIDALGYPSIPLPPFASSSVNNSPSSARRAVSASRGSSSIFQSPSQDRMPTNATSPLHHSRPLNSGMYPSSLGVQGTSYPSMPSSPSSHPSLVQQQQHQANPHHSGVFNGPPAAFPGTGLASPHAQSSLAIQQQQAQIQQYIMQAQYQYQQLMQQQTQSNGAASMRLHRSHHPTPYSQHSASAVSSPSLLARTMPSPGFLDPTQGIPMHVQAGGSSSGGSNRSSVHHSQASVSSRSSSPQPSLAGQSMASYSTEPSSVGPLDMPTMTGQAQHRSHHQLNGGPHIHPLFNAQYLQQQQAQQHATDPQALQQDMNLVHKMVLMQAQIQYAMQQNEAQQQHAHSQQQHLFQSAPATSANARSVSTGALPQTPHTATSGPVVPSPSLYADVHPSQAQVPFLLHEMSSPLASTSYPYPSSTTRSKSVIGTHQHPSQPQLLYQQHMPQAGPSSTPYPDGWNPAPTVRRRQSTPAFGADSTISPLGATQASSSIASPFMSAKKRNRRNSRPFRMSSYGQAPVDSPDYLSSPVHDASAHYDQDMDMSHVSNSFAASPRPRYDRRRSSLITPTSPLMGGQRERKTRQKERERETLRQMQLDDEEVTNNEDDIKADLELLARMQEEEGKREVEGKVPSLDDIMKKMKSMETVLERRGKELEIAKWKLKCVEVDRRSIEAEVSLLGELKQVKFLIPSSCCSIRKRSATFTRERKEQKLV